MGMVAPLFLSCLLLGWLCLGCNGDQEDIQTASGLKFCAKEYMQISFIHPLSSSKATLQE